MRYARCIFFFVLFFVPGSQSGSAEPGLVARWDFDRGKGRQAEDTSGNGNDGIIHGAKWVASGEGYSLQFDGVDDYVDCGNDASLDLRGPLTMAAWIRPSAPPRGEPGILGKFFESYAITFYRGSAWFYISGGGNNLKNGLTVGKWQHLIGVFDGDSMHLYINGERVATKESLQKKTAKGDNFLLGCVSSDPDNIDKALGKTAFFAGQLDSVRVYDRPLSDLEIIHYYNNEATEKGCRPIDAAKIGQLVVTPYVYPSEKQLIAEVDYRWIKPLPEGTDIRVSLAKITDGEAVVLNNHSPLMPSKQHTQIEFDFPLESLDTGHYQLTATFGKHEAKDRFTLPATEPQVLSPDEKLAGPLPNPTVPPKFKLHVSEQGGMTVTIGQRSFPVESTFSYPHGGDNSLTVTKPKESTAESKWKVHAEKGPDETHRVRAEGDFYCLDRQIRSTDTRIEIEDTFTNKTEEVLGIIFSNHISLTKLADANPILHANPTVFVAREGCGLGLIALDDVYFLQLENGVADGLAYLRDAHFGLAAGASHTVKWAIYPTATENYYDFINQVRHDENLNGYVRGGLTLSAGWVTPSNEEVRIKGLGYFSQCYLTRVLSNPSISLEGWEFDDHPEVAERIRQTLKATREQHPELQVGFHVAHALYAMNNPDRFSDSKAIAEDGSQIMYGPNTMEYYGRYFSPELIDDNWRWWIFYPTLENSFGKKMLDAADKMIHQLGANFIWADGYISGYVKDGYTYDHFDGHSVTIDPKTKLVTRKKTNVTLAALPVLKAVAQKFAKAGGTLVSNGLPGPPSYWKEPTVTSNETGGGDQQPISAMHLGRTVTPLGNPNIIHSERDIYRDVLAKLDLGALYFFYGETDHRAGGHNYITRQSLVTHMYPITFDRIEPGVVWGQERIVTNKSGVYGWHGDRSLHQVFLSDARGRIVPNRFTTTVEDDGLRTELQLAKNESTVIAKIPVTCEADGPVNLRVESYHTNELVLSLNAKSPVRIILQDGKLPVAAGRSFQLQINDQQQTIEATSDSLEISLDKNGLTQIVLRSLLAVEQ